MGDVVLFVEDFKSNPETKSHCRICHEEEFESCNSLEAPCACSGTVKVAKRNKNVYPLFWPMRVSFDHVIEFWFGIVSSKFICFLLSVCSQRLHTEVVLREGKHNLWNLSPGLFSKWIRTSHSALILMIFICNLLKLYWYWEEKKQKKSVFKFLFFFDSEFLRTIFLSFLVLFWIVGICKPISLSPFFFFFLLGVKDFCDILVSLPSKNRTSFGF